MNRCSTPVVIRMPFVLLALSVGLACQSQKPTGDFADPTTGPAGRTPADFLPIEEVLRLRSQQSQALDDLVNKSTMTGSLSERSAAILATIDEPLAKLTSTLAAIRKAEDVVISNLINTETTAYKAARPVFGPDGRTLSLGLDLSQGSLDNTGRTRDLAIEGDGFFKVRITDAAGDGFGYTRNGNFFANKEGNLVLGMGDGYKLEPAINIPNDAADISISQNGSVQYTRSPTGDKVLAGQLKLTRFRNPDALKLVGGSIYVPTEANGSPTESNPGEKGLGLVLQGYLEASNVDPIKERLRFIRLKEWHDAIVHAITLAAPPAQHAAADQGK